jgi:hypothetical protein
MSYAVTFIVMRGSYRLTYRLSTYDYDYYYYGGDDDDDDDDDDDVTSIHYIHLASSLRLP